MPIAKQQGNVCAMFRRNVASIAKAEKIRDISGVQKSVRASFAKDRSCQSSREVWGLRCVSRRSERIVAREPSSSTNPIAHLYFGHMCRQPLA